jgi:hypothetical protein
MFEIQRPIPAAKPRLKNGLKPLGALGALLAALALLVGLAGPVAAESTTVTGSGPLEKMAVSNGQDAVVAKVHGPGNPCNVVRWVKIRFRDQDGTRYTADGACLPGDPASGGGWHKSLARGTNLVACGGYRLKYNATGAFWRFEIPRSCLTKLGNSIKVTAGELVTTTSAIPGEAGPTGWLSRG